MFTNQFDVEHRGIIRRHFVRARGNPESLGARAAFSVAAAILAAVEGGILPPGKNGRFFGDSRNFRGV